MATDPDLAAVESADLDSRGMVVELAMLDSPEFTSGDEIAVRASRRAGIRLGHPAASSSERARRVSTNTRAPAPPRTNSAALT